MYKGIVQKLMVIFIFHSGVFICQSQNFSIHDSIKESMNRIPYDLKPQEWQNIQKMWSKKSHPVKIQLTNDSIVFGQILNYNDNELILWTDVHSFFNPYYIDSELIILDGESLRHIFKHPGFDTKRSKKGILWGTVIGAGIGTALVIFVGQGWIPFYYALVPTALGTGTGYLIDLVGRYKYAGDSEMQILTSDREKEKITIFPDGFPEAVSYKSGSTRLDTAAFLLLTFDAVLAKSPIVKKIFRKPAFSIAVQHVKSLAAFDDNNSSNYFEPSFGLSARFNLSKRLYTGYSFRNNQYYKTGWDYLPAVSGFSEYYNLKNKNHTLFIQYALLTPGKYLTRGFELTAGIGASLNKLDLQLSQGEIYNSLHGSGGESYEYTDLYYEYIEKVSPGLLLLADLGYYFSKAVSLNITLEKSFIRDLETEQQTVTIPRTGESVTFESQKINPSSFSYSFGIRLHF